MAFFFYCLFGAPLSPLQGYGLAPSLVDEHWRSVFLSHLSLNFHYAPAHRGLFAAMRLVPFHECVIVEFLRLAGAKNDQADGRKDREDTFHAGRDYYNL